MSANYEESQDSFYTQEDTSYSVTIDHERLCADSRGGLSLRTILGNSLLKLQGTSVSAAIFLTVNAALGAGLLNFSYAFDKAGGILVGILMQLVLVSFLTGALLILSICCDMTKCTSYQDIVLYFCGKKVHEVCTIFIILYSYGSCLTYLIVIGDQFDRVLASLFGNNFCHFWYMNRNFTMSLCSTLFILPLCFSKTIDFLKYASSVGVLATVYIIFMIIYEYFVSAEAGPLPEMKTQPDNWTDLFLIIPVICFAYQCHISWVPTYAAMTDRSRKSLLLSVLLSMFVLLVSYTAASVFGYMTFGSQVASDLMQSYDARKPVVLIGILTLCIKTLTCYPVMLFCGREAVDEVYCKLRGYSIDEAAIKEPVRRAVIATTWFATSVLVAVGIPDIGIAVQFLGSLSAIVIFIIPGWCLLKIVLMKDASMAVWKNIVLLITAALFLSLGACVFGEALSHCIINTIKENENPGVEQLCI